MTVKKKYYEGFAGWRDHIAELGEWQSIPHNAGVRLDQFTVVAEELRNDPAYRSDPFGLLYEDAAAVAEEADILEGESISEYYDRIAPAILRAIQAYIDDAVELYGVPLEYQERAERIVNAPVPIEDIE